MYMPSALPRVTSSSSSSVKCLSEVCVIVCRDFVVKQPPVAIQLKEAAKVKSGSAQPNRDKVGEVTWEQIEAIARDKMPDLNCFTVEAAMRMVAGTARSMGINVKGEFPKK